MRVITEEDLLGLIEGMNKLRHLAESDLAKQLHDQSIDSLRAALRLAQEIDQLTVSKLRPMNEAVKYEYVLGFTKPDGISYEICSDGNGHFWTTKNTFFKEDDLYGWVPKPQYKPT